MTEDRYVGLDLGWTTGATGMAAVDVEGRLTASGRVMTDDEIAAWLDTEGGRVVVAAVDAPLVVPNETGMRVPERLMATTFGAFGASAHVSNQAKFGGGPSRAMRLATRFGWTVDPDAPPDGSETVCIEVYPHPAMVGLFELGYRVDYKKGNTERRLPGFRALVGHLESLAELRLHESPRWSELREIVADPRPGDLNRVEDELDAILCAHLAWLWHRRRDALQVYGSLAEGYIVAPPPPTHRAVRPDVVPVVPQTAPGVAFERFVPGRPTGYAGGANEQVWKTAVRSRFAGCSLPADCRVQVELAFTLAPEQRGRNEPDLDNLVKSTIDAMEEVLGERPGTGSRREADDVRIDRIVATKRPFQEGTTVGAQVVVSELSEST